MAAEYKITAIDAAKNHITFQVIIDGKVVDTQKRCDIDLIDVEAVKAELTRYAIDIEAAVSSSPSVAVDADVSALINKPQEAIAPVVEEAPVDQPVEG